MGSEGRGLRTEPRDLKDWNLELAKETKKSQPKKEGNPCLRSKREQCRVSQVKGIVSRRSNKLCQMLLLGQEKDKGWKFTSGFRPWRFLTATRDLSVEWQGWVPEQMGELEKAGVDLSLERSIAIKGSRKT